MSHYPPCNIILLLYGKRKEKTSLVEGNVIHTCISMVLGSPASQQLASDPRCLLPSHHKANQSCGQCLHNFAEPAYLKLQNVQWDCFSLMSVTCIQQERFQLVDAWHVDLTGVPSTMHEKILYVKTIYWC